MTMATVDLKYNADIIILKKIVMIKNVKEETAKKDTLKIANSIPTENVNSMKDVLSNILLRKLLMLE